MNKMIQNLFPTYLLHKKFKDYKLTNKKVIPILNELFNQKNALVPPWISTGWTKSTFPRVQGMNPIGKKLDILPEMKEATEAMLDACQEYFDLLKVSKKYKPELQEVWAQRYTEGRGDVHNHTKSLVGGALYLHVEGEQTITFENHLLHLYDSNLLSSFESESFSYTVKLEAGDLLVWPGWMNHSIEAKLPDNWNDDATRITVPFMAIGVEK